MTTLIASFITALALIYVSTVAISLVVCLFVIIARAVKNPRRHK